FSAEGAPLGEIHKFLSEGEKETLETVEGMALDAQGTLFVYQANHTILKYRPKWPNRGPASRSTPKATSTPGPKPPKARAPANDGRRKNGRNWRSSRSWAPRGRS